MSDIGGSGVMDVHNIPKNIDRKSSKKKVVKSYVEFAISGCHFDPSKHIQISVHPTIKFIIFTRISFIVNMSAFMYSCIGLSLNLYSDNFPINVVLLSRMVLNFLH